MSLSGTAPAYGNTINGEGIGGGIPGISVTSGGDLLVTAQQLTVVNDFAVSGTFYDPNVLPLVGNLTVGTVGVPKTLDVYGHLTENMGQKFATAVNLAVKLDLPQTQEG